MLLSFYKTSDDVFDYESTLMNMQNIRNKMEEVGLKEIDILIAQVKLETGHLKYVRYNNLFGFTAKKYMHFSRWDSCIAYAKKWQDKKYKGGDYYMFLKKLPYAQDKNYINKLKKLNTNENIHR